jgi:hypothetical protein
MNCVHLVFAVVVVVVGLQRPLQKFETRALDVFVGQTFEVGRSLAGIKVFA